MARVHPPLDQIRPASSGEYAERAVLTALSEGLDARFHLFHSTHWAVADGAADRQSELDVVVNDTGDVDDVALREVLAGAQARAGQSLFESYGFGSEVATQLGAREVVKMRYPPCFDGAASELFTSSNLQDRLDTAVCRRFPQAHPLS